MTLLKRYWKAFFEGVGFVGAVASIAAVAGGGAASWLAGAIWPVGVVAAESVALAAAFGWIVYSIYSRRSVGVGEADQKLLDELLGLLSRPSIQLIEEGDFAEPWHRSVMFPVTVFIHEYGAVEHRFDDGQPEALRARLYQTATEFADAEAINAFVYHDRSQRFVGVVGWEAEGDPDLLETLEGRSLAIRGPSRDFLVAHTELVERAKERQCDLTALTGSGAPHPAVQRLRDLDAERPTASPDDPQAKW